MSDAVVIGILSGSGSAAVVQIVLWLRNRRQDSAMADKTVGEAWQEIVTELRSDISDLRDRVGTLEDDLHRERQEAQHLRDQIKRYRAIIQSLLRYMLKLRDSLVSEGQQVPPFPQDVEDAMTDPGLP